MITELFCWTVLRLVFGWWNGCCLSYFYYEKDVFEHKTRFEFSIKTAKTRFDFSINLTKTPLEFSKKTCRFSF